jgi:hypothetical protein
MPDKNRLTSYSRFAIMLLVIGALLGVDSMWHLAFFYKLWPVIITILGAGFIGIFRTRGRKEAMYLTVGIFLICFSGLAQYCVFTWWSRLATLWPLFVTFSGIAMIFAYHFCQKKKNRLLVGLLLVSLSIVFFFVFSISAGLWWTAFLLVGASVWIAERE